jgi:hypothetical protein
MHPGLTAAAPRSSAPRQCRCRCRCHAIRLLSAELMSMLVSKVITKITIDWLLADIKSTTDKRTLIRSGFRAARTRGILMSVQSYRLQKDCLVVYSVLLQMLCVMEVELPAALYMLIPVSHNNCSGQALYRFFFKKEWLYICFGLRWGPDDWV